MPRLRTRRATVESIYQSCKATNTCPADVINRIEQNTLADRLLKWISGFLFFGNLGIGTGAGTGGRLGYVPLEAPRLGGGATTTRPPIVPDTLGIMDVLGPPPGEIDATSPSIVPLFDGSTSGTIDVETVAEVHPAPPPTITSNLGGVAETTGDILPGTDPPIETAVSHTQFTNPTYEITTSSSDTVAEISTGDHVLAVGGASGQSIGEDIPLLPLQPESSADISDILETDFGGRTSTPRGELSRVRGDRATLYSRYITQQEVTNPTFLTTPYDLVTFNNPAFEGTDSFDFPRGSPYTVEAAPDPNFTDLIHLGHARYSTTPSGHVRVSRLGTRTGVLTRNRTILTGQTHFYQDLSSIHETIELPTISSTSPPSTAITIADSGPLSNTIDSSFEIIDLALPQDTYSEEDLLDIYEDIGTHTQLVIGHPKRPTTINIPTVNKVLGESVVDTTNGVFNDHTENSPTILTDRDNNIVISFPHLTSYDFLPHPSLLRRKRKRSLLDDGSATE
ncbi:L2 [Trichechus manatus papillomavirus]|nr:L2 [Trichechus manatus papillomavirus]